MTMVSCDDNTNNPVQPHYADCGEASDHWKIISSENPSGFYPRDILFPSAEVGYVVSNGGTIMKTMDAGATWQILNDLDSPNPVTKSVLTTVNFINNQIGFIGSRGIYFVEFNEPGSLFLKTSDGGITWSKNRIADVDEFYDLLFYNQQEGLAIARLISNSKLSLIRTQDGGDTWNEISISGKRIKSYEFNSFGSTIFMLVEDDQYDYQLAVSHDLGITWELKSLPVDQIGYIRFINEQIGFVSFGKVYKTEDGGNTWTYISSGPMSNPTLVHFATGKQGIVINEEYEYYSEGGELNSYLVAYNISETSDGGLTWSSTLVNAECDLRGAYFSYSPEIFYTMEGQCNRFEFK